MSHNLSHGETTGNIIGACFKVHTALGNGFPEVIYQRALAIEFKKRGLSFEREQSKPIYYSDHPEPVGHRIADFVVEGKVIVELKAISKLETTHFNQVLNYLNAFRMDLALLINFGGPSLEFKRIISTNNQ